MEKMNVKPRPKVAPLHPLGFFVKKLTNEDKQDKKRRKFIGALKIIRVTETYHNNMYEFAVSDKMPSEGLINLMRERIYEEELNIQKISPHDNNPSLEKHPCEDKVLQLYYKGKFFCGYMFDVTEGTTIQLFVRDLPPSKVERGLCRGFFPCAFGRV
mmetsp:Transcript_14358/g.21812  ORF Transcript_14358/g.21812 Transcript_14358/m.21812 type:complete len:157 (-) Transcript_14358:128-598(-)